MKSGGPTFGLRYVELGYHMRQSSPFNTAVMMVFHWQIYKDCPWPL
jgi:hypothetical protein